jgi:hypothetical protein
MEIEVRRPNDVTRIVDRFQKNVNDLKASPNVSISELLTSEFMHKCSDFSSLEELLASGQLMKEGERLTKMRFDAIPQNDLDRLVTEKTRFTSWDSMIREAFKEYVNRRVMEGVR